MKKNENIEWRETWAEELVEQAKQDSRIFKRMLYLSLAVNVLLAVVIFFK